MVYGTKYNASTGWAVIWNLKRLSRLQLNERIITMKLKKDFIVHDAGDETMLVATGSAKFSGLVKGNKTAGDVLELLKTDTTEAEIIRKMHEKYDAPEGAIERDVKKMITELRKIGAIDG